MIYSNGSYFVVHTRYPKNRRYKVMSCNYKKHTHVRTKKEAIDLANFAKHHQIPMSAKPDYLISLLRISDNLDMKVELTNLIETKLGRRRYRDV